jgi:hypothetical protein
MVLAIMVSTMSFSFTMNNESTVEARSHMKKAAVKALSIVTLSMAVLTVSSVSCFAGDAMAIYQTPEPLSILLLGAGMAGLAGLKKFFR